MTVTLRCKRMTVTCTGEGRGVLQVSESEHCETSWSAGVAGIGIDRVEELAGSAR